MWSTTHRRRRRRLRRRAERPGRLAGAQITCFVRASIVRLERCVPIVIVCCFGAFLLFSTIARTRTHMDINRARRKFKVCGPRISLDFCGRSSSSRSCRNRRRSRRRRGPQTATNWKRIAHLSRRTRARRFSHFAGASLLCFSFVLPDASGGLGPPKLELELHFHSAQFGWKNCFTFHGRGEGEFSGGFSSRDFSRSVRRFAIDSYSARWPALRGVLSARLFVLIAFILC